MGTSTYGVLALVIAQSDSADPPEWFDKLDSEIDHESECWDDYMADTLRKDVKDLPIEMGYYGGSDSLSRFFALRGYIMEQECWDLSGVTLKTPTDSELVSARDCCEKLGIPWSEPKWMLTAYRL